MPEDHQEINRLEKELVIVRRELREARQLNFVDDIDDLEWNRIRLENTIKSVRRNSPLAKPVLVDTPKQVHGQHISFLDVVREAKHEDIKSQSKEALPQLTNKEPSPVENSENKSIPPSPVFHQK